MLMSKAQSVAACLVALPFLCGGLGLSWSQEPGLTKPWFDSGGVPIHYLVTGREDGEPVVLIHGFASSIEAQWTPVIEALKKDYKVIAMDIRGCGGSGKPHDPKKYGIEMVNDLVRLLDHLQIDKAHIVGYSMSAGTALCLTVHHGQRVRTLSCCGAGTRSARTERSGRGAGRAVVRAHGKIGQIDGRRVFISERSSSGLGKNR